jgi:alcohol dehydrogenase class IV
LPFVVAMNVRALRQRQPDGLALRRYDEVARCLTGRLAAVAADGVAWLQALTDALRIPSLSAYGLREVDLALVSDKARLTSSVRTNPIELRADELGEILRQAL